MAKFLVSTRTPGLRFKILRRVDKEKGIFELVGPMGAKFERVLTEATLEKYGYTIAEENDDAEQSGVQAQLQAGVQDGSQPGGNQGQHAPQASTSDDAEEGDGQAGTGRGPQEAVVEGWG